MLRAESVIFHSRPIAPTRRLALGRQWLPGDSGPVLLGAVCARFSPQLTDDFTSEVAKLTHELESGRPVAQPRLRHRLQLDRVGLARSRQRLHARGKRLIPEFDGTRATPGQLVLGTVYAAGTVPEDSRGPMMRAVRRGLAWHGEIGPALISYLSEPASSAALASESDPVGWALEQLGFDCNADALVSSTIQRGFREALRVVHPDLGASEAEAADRIAELREARRILLTRNVAPW